MEKSNWVPVLIVGGVLGFLGGHYTAAPAAAPMAANPVNGQGTMPTAMANGGASDNGRTPKDLPPAYIQESAFAPGTFDGMTDQQKYVALKVANERNCTCGCQNDTIAKCRTQDPTCSTAPQLLGNIIADAKAGLSSAAILAKNNAPKAPPKPSEDPNLVFKVPVDDSPIRGNADAKVTIVEFSDFQCPFCSKAAVTVDEVRAKYGQDVRIVYKENPLPFHPNAMPAAKSALAAGKQGKFWEMYDLQFKNQQKLAAEDLEGYAKSLGLDVARWKADAESEAVKAQIAKEMALAQQLGASGTPAFFINGHKLVGAQPIDAFSSVIDAQKTLADAKLASGTKPSDLYAALTANGVTSPPAAPAGPQNAPPPAAARRITIEAFNPVEGPKVAPVTIVMWSDFQCPFCSKVEPTLKQVRETYGDKVKIVWRNQPLPFHNNAMPAAKAAMAAAEQGKFWELHDKMFANQAKLAMSDIEGYAKDVGLNLAKWKADMESTKVKDEIETDMKYGSQVDASGTPTFYVNGKQIGGAMPFDTFKALIDAQLTQADALAKKGVKPDEMYAKQTDANLAAAPAAAAPAAEDNIKVDLGNSPARGPSDAKVTIVEFSDFQCPFCSRGYNTLTEIENQYKGKVKVVFKNNPLPFHQNAKPAAEAALAANEQGKFWEMYDQLFKNQTKLERDSLDSYAQAIGLDMGKYKSAMDSHKFAAKVDDELKQGAAAGVSGTPTFVINGHKLVGAQPADAFKNIIDAELAKKK